jgi:hypothetical protein
MEQRKSALVDINEIIACYLPVSRKKARKFVALYLDSKKIGNRIYVERAKLEAILTNPNRENFPLEV